MHSPTSTHTRVDITVAVREGWREGWREGTRASGGREGGAERRGRDGPERRGREDWRAGGMEGTRASLGPLRSLLRSPSLPRYLAPPLPPLCTVTSALRYLCTVHLIAHSERNTVIRCDPATSARYLCKVQLIAHSGRNTMSVNLIRPPRH